MTTETKPDQTSVAKAAIDTQQQPAELKPGEVMPEVVNIPSAPNPFAEDDAKLAAMQAEQAKIDAAAQAAANAGTAQPGAAPAGTPAAPDATAQPAKTGEAKAADASKNTVESALIAIRRKAKELNDRNLVLEGENRALKSFVQPGSAAAPAGEPAPDAPAQPVTFDEAFAAVDAEYAQIAEKVDNGELSMKDAEVKRAELRARERALNEDRATQVAQEIATQAAADPRRDLGLKEHAVKLEQDFPVLKKVSVEQLKEIERKVYAKAVLDDNPIPEGAIGTKRLREEMAVLAEQKYDPTAAAARAAKKSGQAAPGTNGQAQPSGGAQPGTGTTLPTAQQREAKLQAAGNMPPDIGTMGAPASGGEITDAQGAAIVAGLKDDELIRWLDANPRFRDKHMAGVLRPTR